MDWKQLFAPNILLRGKRYFEEGRVDVLGKNGIKYETTVFGSGNSYSVEIIKRPNGTYHMFCNCPYARDGNRCKHMAAVLYAIDDKEAKEEQSKLFHSINYDGYYFNMYEIIKDCIASDSNINKAKQIYENKQYENIYITLGYLKSSYNPIQVLSSSFIVNENNPNRQATSAVIKKNGLERSYCPICENYVETVYYFSYRKKLCHHQIALLYVVNDYVLKVNPGDDTSLSGRAMLETFEESSNVIQIDTKVANVKLQPQITLDEYSLTLGFKIGSEKMYVLRNMDSFVPEYEQQSAISLGKNYQIDFSKEDFDKDSKEYYEFIKKRVYETDTLNHQLVEKNSFRQYDMISINSKIPLYGTMLDEFYNSNYGKEIPCADKRSNKSIKSLKFEYKSISVKLIIEPYYNEFEEFSGIAIHAELPTIIHGSQDSYYVIENHLSRFSKEEYQLLKPFLPINQHYDNQYIVIGMNFMSQFYYDVYPQLEASLLFDIKEIQPDLIRSHLCGKGEYSFYLDVDEASILCKTNVTYDEDEYPVLPLFATEEKRFGTKRDYLKEEKILEEVTSYFPYYNEENASFHQEKDENYIFNVLNEGIPHLLNYGDVHATDAFNRLKLRKTPIIKLGVSIESNLLDIDIMSEGIDPEELLEILDKYQKKKQYHLLKNGEFLSLEDNETLDALIDMMNSMNIPIRDFTKGKLHLPLYRTLYLDTLLQEHENVLFDRNQKYNEIIRNFETIKNAEYEIPENVKKILRPYQLYGYQWLHTLYDMNFGGILADEMGLGKSLQVITLIQALKIEKKLDFPVLIICPTSLVYNWKEEFLKFSKNLNLQLVVGTPSERKKIIQKENADVFITSYDLIRRDIGNYEEKRFSVQILDEAQFVKNAHTSVSKTVRVINSDFRLALTGTPIENRLSELWSIFDFIMPGYLFRYDYFKQHFETPIAKNKDAIQSMKLKKMVSPFILRRLKKDVLRDLPEKLEEIQFAQFDTKQKSIYDGQLVHMKKMIENLDESSGESKIKILAELMKIRQICCDPSLILENYDGESAKRIACIELIESGIESGHKMLVFSQFTSMLELIEKDLIERNISYYKITGSTSKEDRIKYVNQFNHDETPVFLISLKAGGTGLNLVGADMVIHYDPWWNIAVQNQATDRAHRIGQTNIVNVYKLIAKGTIEEKIIELQEAKKDLAESILSGDNTSITSLSKEELLELLK